MQYIFDKNKNELLKAERGISFEDIIESIENDAIVRVTQHPNAKKYPNQYIYELNIKGYIWRVPFLKTEDTNILKTAYPCRKATKLHLKGNDDEEDTLH